MCAILLRMTPWSFMPTSANHSSLPRQAYSLRRMLALWHAYTAAQALGWARLRAAASALVLGRIPERGTEKWPAQ